MMSEGLESSVAAVAYHVTTREAAEAILQAGLWPQIGPRSFACGERHPAIYLFPTRLDVEDALQSWLGEAFANIDEAGLVILEVAVSYDDVASPCVNGSFEIVKTQLIPPSMILGVLGEDFEPMAELARRVSPGL